MGISVSADGQCHYFAKPGTDDLTLSDWIGSHYCYGYRCKHFDLFFFNVVTNDDGRTPSTPWIIDDATFYCSPAVAGRHDNGLMRIRRR